LLGVLGLGDRPTPTSILYIKEYKALQLIPSAILDQFKHRKDSRNIIYNMGWLFADRIIRMGIGLFVGIWVAKYLGAEQFGLLSYAMAFVTLFSTLSTLGLPYLVIQKIICEPEKRDQILGTTFLLQFFAGMVSLLLSLGTICVVRHGDFLMLSMVAILASSAIFQSFDTIDLLFQAQIQSKYTVLAKNSAFSIIALGKIVLITIHAPLLAFAGANLAEAVFGAIGLVVCYKNQYPSQFKWFWDTSLAKTLLSESWPLILSGLTIVVYMKIDQIMLGQMVGTHAVGIYSAAARISEVWYFIPTAIASSVSPAIYAAKKESDESQYYRRISQSLRLLSFAALLISVPMSFLSGKVVFMLFGQEYAASGLILAIHIWAALFVFIGAGSASWFVAEGLTHFSLRRNFLGAIINLVLNFFLIPIYEGAGAAIATVLSYAVAGFLANAFHPKTRKLFDIQLRALRLF
jgi:polysaccharide transporter, PST family